MKAEFIAVGTELLLGEITDTNGAFVSRELARVGVDIYYRSVVGDNRERLLEVLDAALHRADVVILSGGLGPTNDDITKQTVSSYFGLTLEENPEAMANLASYFSSRGRQMPEVNRIQACFPKEAEILKNNNGTAPGMFLNRDGKYVFLLPGPPREFEPMVIESVLPRLSSATETRLFTYTVHTFGISESALYEKLRDLIDTQDNPTIALYAEPGQVRIRLAAKATDDGEAKSIFLPIEKEINRRVGKYIYGFGEDLTLSKAVVQKLTEKNLKVATAESCTGGLIGKMITDVPGSSAVYNIGYVTYSNAAKHVELSVSKTTLEKYGAVSQQVAEEMAYHLRKKTKAHIAVVSTGIAGPDGGTPEKPVGLVYVAVATHDGVKVEKLNLSGNRDRVRTLAAKHALWMVLCEARAYISE